MGRNRYERDERETARVVLLVVVAAMVGNSAWEICALLRDPSGWPGALLRTLGLLAILVPSVWSMRHLSSLPRLTPVVLGLGTVVVVVACVLGSDDPSASGQLGFILVVLFAGVSLVGFASWLVAGFALVGHAVVVVVLAPQDAAGDIAMMAGVVIGLMVVLHTLWRQRDELVASLDRLAHRDELTGVLTRRGLAQAARELGLDPDLQVGGTEPAPCGAGQAGLVVVDIDHFKVLNDRYGHPVGDAALVQVADLLREIGGDRAALARIGGDEFALLVAGPAGDVELVAQVLRERVRERPVAGAAADHRLSVSTGVAHTDSCGPALGRLYRAADEQLYRAKRAGHPSEPTRA